MDEQALKIDPLHKVWDPDTRIGDMLKGSAASSSASPMRIPSPMAAPSSCAPSAPSWPSPISMKSRSVSSSRSAEQIEASLLLPLDVEQPGELEAVFKRIEAEWGQLDFVIHSIAFAPRADLHGRVVDCSKDGFLQAMRVSCYSFIEMARLAEPLMKHGGSLLTMSYYGADKVVNHYNVMGPVKSALEATTRYLAAELGEKGIRVYAVSPGPLKTRAASGIADFDELVEAAVKRSPAHRLVDIAEVGRVAAFLVGGAASGMTGDTIYVDGGLHNVA